MIIQYDSAFDVQYMMKNFGVEFSYCDEILVDVETKLYYQRSENIGWNVNSDDYDYNYYQDKRFKSDPLLYFINEVDDTSLLKFKTFYAEYLKQISGAFTVTEESLDIFKPKIGDIGFVGNRYGKFLDDIDGTIFLRCNNGIYDMIMDLSDFIIDKRKVDGEYIQFLPSNEMKKSLDKIYSSL